MSFQRAGTTIHLDDSRYHQPPSQMSFSQLQRATLHGSIASFYHISLTPTLVPSVNLAPDPAASLRKPLLALLQQFSHVISTPQGLPPDRPTDHRIPLILGSSPVNVRPYHYPHFQKNEMERMIQHMIVDGIIVPSQSPFSSSILLVKKKDGSWRFCMDYRAVNAIIVKDHSPIPTVDELLDELMEQGSSLD